LQKDSEKAQKLMNDLFKNKQKSKVIKRIFAIDKSQNHMHMDSSVHHPKDFLLQSEKK
jgi:hypothetical protein